MQKQDFSDLLLTTIVGSIMFFAILKEFVSGLDPIYLYCIASIIGISNAYILTSVKRNK